MAVPAEEALETAHADALRKLLEVEDDDRYRATLTWSLQDLESRLEPVEFSPAELAQYVGRYGPRRIYLEDGQLFYQRDERPPYRLEPMGDDLFRVGDLDFFRLTFGRDESGGVTEIVGLYDDGHTDTNVRDES
jgi:hypothetical protein